MEKDVLKFRYIEKDIEFKIRSDISFGSDRLVIANFTALEDRLSEGLKRLNLKSKLFSKGAEMVIHPLRVFDGGLSEVEEIALVQACIGAGAAHATVHVGSALTKQEALAKCV